MKSFKKVTKAGGINIPLALRRDYNIQPGDSFEFEAAKDGGLLLKRQAAHCILCDGAEDISYYNGKLVCGNCINGLKEARNGL